MLSSYRLINPVGLNGVRVLNTFDEPETNIVLPKQAEKILQILKDSGDWLSRDNIAKGLGKRKTLNPQEMAYMEVMTLNHLIEEKQEPADTPTGYKWVYKAVNSDS